ncbi:uncharacterized protein [Spinacia oleracea]|uniref:Uncharacterized protein n=1 Tax=Spinacia oleracea TaxID=3562 RepID=A0ABM3R8Y1_SPIOL|nr:uncharacterized protein LOC130467557 [Spinacia oleracea]
MESNNNNNNNNNNTIDNVQRQLASNSATKNGCGFFGKPATQELFGRAIETKVKQYNGDIMASDQEEDDFLGFSDDEGDGINSDSDSEEGDDAADLVQASQNTAAEFGDIGFNEDVPNSTEYVQQVPEVEGEGQQQTTNFQENMHHRSCKNAEFGTNNSMEAHQEENYKATLKSLASRHFRSMQNGKDKVGNQTDNGLHYTTRTNILQHV